MSNLNDLVARACARRRSWGLRPSGGTVLDRTARTLTLTPATGQSGTTSVTVTVSDGVLSASRMFTYNVAAAVVVPPVVGGGTGGGGSGSSNDGSDKGGGVGCGAGSAFGLLVACLLLRMLARRQRR